MPMDETPVHTDSPAAIRMSVVVLCALVAVSTLPWLWMALGRFGGFAWGLFGFELIVLIGCVMTALVCLGSVRVGGALPLAIACLAGTLLVDAVFALHVDARNLIGSNHPDVQPWVNRMLLFRLGVIGLLTLIATLDVYRRDARSWGLMLRAAAFLIPVIACIAWIRLRGVPTVTTPDGELSPLKMVLVMVGGLLLGILFSAGGHFLIRSYEIAVPEKTGKTPA
ncbi:MAG: hypothetical protein WD114_05095 [Phycisphaerales bacterium]